MGYEKTQRRAGSPVGRLGLDFRPRRRILPSCMGTTTRQQATPQSAYAGLDFIKAAFCPLEFTATKLGKHPDFVQLRKDKALAVLEVGPNLHYPRQFPFTDPHGHRKTGTQIITAPFGLAPKDFDLFLGLYTYLRRLPELPADGRTHLTVDFLARHLGLPATCQKDYLRIRSRIFRFSFVKYTNSAFWNGETKTYDIVNFGFFNIAALSRVTESRRPVTFEWDPSFLRLVAKQRLPRVRLPTLSLPLPHPAPALLDREPRRLEPAGQQHLRRRQFRHPSDRLRRQSGVEPGPDAQTPQTFGGGRGPRTHPPVQFLGRIFPDAHDGAAQRPDCYFDGAGGRTFGRRKTGR